MAFPIARIFDARARKIAAVLLAALLVFAVFLTILAYHAEPLLRARVIETLSTRFKSRVDLAGFTVSFSAGLGVSGSGLKIYGQSDPNIHREGVQPLIEVDEFRFRTHMMSLLRSPMHVGTVFIKGMTINIPPKGDRAQFQSMGPKNGKIKIVVDHFLAEETRLVVNTNRLDRLPLEFEIQKLDMQDIGPDRPLSFTATLVNPKPVGDIASQGEFGPFQADEPRNTPVRGKYTFSHADLSTLKGIGGMLSSTGNYQGSLGNIVVEGETDTPDFRINISGRPVPLKTSFHAIVDGTSGDTYLRPVNATLFTTSFSATGKVVRSAQPMGHHIQLDVTMPGGKIEHLLLLATATNPPAMTGAVQMQAKLDLLPGPADIADRLYLQGRFVVSDAHFSNKTIQSKVDDLSLRSQGKPKLATDNIPDNVKSKMNGNFVLKNALLQLPDLLFEMPGTRVSLRGNYALDGNQFDFHGHARFDAKLSQMVGGWKSLFLKPVDPFFRKNGAGAEFPIKITGTKSDLHFGLDFGHKDKSEDAGSVAKASD